MLQEAGEGQNTVFSPAGLLLQSAEKNHRKLVEKTEKYILGWSLPCLVNISVHFLRLSVVIPYCVHQWNRPFIQIGVLLLSYYVMIAITNIDMLRHLKDIESNSLENVIRWRLLCSFFTLILEAFSPRFALFAFAFIMSGLSMISPSLLQCHSLHILPRKEGSAFNRRLDWMTRMIAVISFLLGTLISSLAKDGGHSVLVIALCMSVIPAVYHIRYFRSTTESDTIRVQISYLTMSAYTNFPDHFNWYRRFPEPFYEDFSQSGMSSLFETLKWLLCDSIDKLPLILLPLCQSLWHSIVFGFVLWWQLISEHDCGQGYRNAFETSGVQILVGQSSAYLVFLLCRTLLFIDDTGDGNEINEIEEEEENDALMQNENEFDETMSLNHINSSNKNKRNHTAVVGLSYISRDVSYFISIVLFFLFSHSFSAVLFWAAYRRCSMILYSYVFTALITSLLQLSHYFSSLMIEDYRIPGGMINSLSLIYIALYCLIPGLQYFLVSSVIKSSDDFTLVYPWFSANVIFVGLLFVICLFLWKSHSLFTIQNHNIKDVSKKQHPYTSISNRDDTTINSSDDDSSEMDRITRGETRLFGEKNGNDLEDDDDGHDLIAGESHSNDVAL